MVSKTPWLVGIGMSAALLLAACQPAGPLQSAERGEEIAFYDFTAPNTFEEGAYGPATLRIAEGRYNIEVFQGDNTVWWGQWGAPIADAILDVDIEHQSEREENTYGVMCRVRGAVGQPIADAALSSLMDDATPEATPPAEATAEATPAAEATVEATAEATESAETGERYGEGDGYLFLVQSSGQAGIFRARGRDLTPLRDWQANAAILRGQAENHLRAVCDGNYLALYVNDVLVAEATDDAYQTGQVGLAASAATRLGANVFFDNLSIAAPAS
jgi:hypothetical protein